MKMNVTLELTESRTGWEWTVKVGVNGDHPILTTLATRGYAHTGNARNSYAWRTVYGETNDAVNAELDWLETIMEIDLYDDDPRDDA